VGAAVANSLAFGLGIRAIGVHHSRTPAFASTRKKRARFPFVALLVSGAHSTDARAGVGDTRCWRNLDEPPESFDKTRNCSGSAIRGTGPARLAQGAGPIARASSPHARATRATRRSHFSFSGLKTAVVTLTRTLALDPQTRADVAAASRRRGRRPRREITRCDRRTGLDRLSSRGASEQLAPAPLLDAAGSCGKFACLPAMEFCTDNGAMIALAGICA